MRVLIVEDEAAVRAEFSALVSERGHEYLATNNSAAALTAHDRAPAQILIIGFAHVALCRAIRSQSRGAEPFIIVVTERDDMRDLETSIAAGADDFTTGTSLRMRLAIAEGMVTQRESRRLAERALVDSERRFAAVFRQSPAAICLFSADDYTFIDVNDAFCKLFAIERDELIGRSARTLVPRLDPDFVGTLGAIPVRGGALVATFDRMGQQVHVLLAVETVEVAGRFCWLATMTDITEQERLRSQLLLADRMASLGTLAAGVAHEINNPLAYVSANIDFVAEQLTENEDDALSEALREARQGCERVSKIVRDLKIFSRDDDQAMGPVDLHAVLESAINLVTNEIRHRARLERDYHDIPFVRAEAGRLGQVFVNLLANAAQAIPEGEAQRNLISVRTGIDQDGMVFVTIADTGCGIPAANVARVFDPFFTTKPVGEGTGLGLSICQAIVTAFGGQIVVDSEEGLGSIFLVTLAPTQATQANVATQLPSPASDARRGRILVIDDEVLITRSLLRVLHHDHDVDAVNSAREGLERLSSGQSYDLILCDLMMPDMTGMDLHKELAEHHRPVLDRLVFLTGGAFTPRARQFLETTMTPWIEKPVDMKALRELIRRRLRPAKNIASRS